MDRELQSVLKESRCGWSDIGNKFVVTIYTELLQHLYNLNRLHHLSSLNTDCNTWHRRSIVNVTTDGRQNRFLKQVKILSCLYIPS